MDSVHTISSVTALTCAWVLTHGPSKPTGLPFLFLTLWLFWMIVSKHLELGCSLFCLLIQCSQSKLGNFLIIITCFRYVWLLSLLPCFWCKTYFWVVFSTGSNRGRIMAICTMSFHRLCLWTLFEYILSDESSNILVISLKMYSFFSIMLMNCLVKAMDKQCWANSTWPEACLIFKRTPKSVVWRAIGVELLNQ